MAWRELKADTGSVTIDTLPAHDDGRGGVGQETLTRTTEGVHSATKSTICTPTDVTPHTTRRLKAAEYCKHVVILLYNVPKDEKCNSPNQSRCSIRL